MKPQITGNTSPPAQYHTVQNAPQSDKDVLAIAAVLAAGYGISKLTQALVPMLSGYNLSSNAIQMALGLSNRGSAALPNAAPALHGLSKSPAALKGVRNQELYFRAAYVLNAAKRIQADLNDDKTIRVALADESLNYVKHENARKGRLSAAAKVARHAELFGNLLGWYLDPTLNNEIECITADGNNFYADTGTIIGYPGSVHPNCGCISGPPHDNAGMVDDAVATILVDPSGKKFHLKAV
jgi:hypothetical protein